jgi:hypothetical protein
VDRLSRRGLILNGLVLGTLGAVALAGAGGGGAPPPLAPGERGFTFDRGGLLRWDNGKTNVASPFAFSLRGGAGQLPLVIGDWRGADFPLNLEAYTSIQPEMMINRAYDHPDGRQVAFTAIGSSSTRKLHRPDICYQAASWKVSALPATPVRLEEGAVTPGRFLVTHYEAREQRLIAYWYLWMDQRRRVEDGAFVMHVASTLRGRSLAEAERSLDSFVRLVIPRALPTPGLLGGIA